MALAIFFRNSAVPGFDVLVLMCAELGAKVPEHRLEKLPQTLIVRL